jgi:hypothetical protein
LLLTGVPLNERFDFSLSDTSEGTMVFSVGYAGNAQQVSAPVPDAFRGGSVRFQVGDYQQADVAQGDHDGGRVTFSQIDELSTAP